MLSRPVSFRGDIVRYFCIGFCTLTWLLTSRADDFSAFVETQTQAALSKWKAPGVAVVVVQGEQKDLLRSHGVLELGQPGPVTADTLFPFGSCTKAITATLIAKLQEEGQLAWDDPVQKHFPGFQIRDASLAAKITLRDCLSHQTGVKGHDDLWYHAPWKRDELFRRMAFLPASGRHRASYEYSTLMVMVAGEAAAKAAGQPWNTLVAKKLLKPLGMTATVLTSADAAKVPQRAVGHDKRADGKIAVMPEYVLPESNAAGSVFTTSRDAAKWLKFLLNDGQGIVSAKGMTELRTGLNPMPLDETIGPVYPDSTSVKYGLGWVVYDYHGQEVVGHGGVMDGFRTIVLFVPKEKLGIAIFCNLHQTKMTIALAHTILDEALKTPKRRDWNDYFAKLETREAEAKAQAFAARDKARILGTKPILPLEKYAGVYRDNAYGEMTLTLQKDQLLWSWSSYRVPLEHYQYDLFRITEGYYKDQLIEFRTRDGIADATRFLNVVFDRQP
jgi:CubicO group peptidase (beta-lactamase class C family)